MEEIIRMLNENKIRYLVKCISTKHLLDSKLSTARPKDEDDISFLKRLIEKQPN